MDEFIEKLYTEAKASNVTLYTSYYGNYRKFPKDSRLVCISSIIPKSNNEMYILSDVRPTWDMVHKYKVTGDYETYTEEYLDSLNANKLLILVALNRIVRECEQQGINNLIFLCYEKPKEFCHRHIFADWINENTGYSISELPNRRARNDASSI